MLPPQLAQTVANDHRAALIRSAEQHRLISSTRQTSRLRNSVGFFLVRAGFRLARVEGARRGTFPTPAGGVMLPVA